MGKERCSDVSKWALRVGPVYDTELLAQPGPAWPDQAYCIWISTRARHGTVAAPWPVRKEAKVEAMEEALAPTA